VPEAVHLPELDLASLQEMAEAGAKVLNAQAVEWARRAKIVIHARKTSDPVGGGRETIALESPEPKHVRAIVGLDRVVHASLPVRDLRAFADLAGQLDVPLLDVAAGSGGDATCAIPLLNVPDWDGSRARLLEKLRSLTLADGCALVSVVGDGLTTSAGALPRFLGVLEGVQAAPRALHAGPLRVAATLESGKLGEAQRALHAAFVG
jgi:aspartate kinase